MSDKKELSNEDLLRFMWNSLHYPDALELDENGDVPEFRKGLYVDAKKSRTYKEFVNHVRNKYEKNKDYILPAIEDFRDYMGGEIPDNLWNAEALKDKDLDVEKWPVSDVESFNSSLAKALGYADNDGVSAFEDMYSKLYGEDDTYLPLLDAISKKIKGENRDEFLRTLDFAQNVEDDYAVNKILEAANRGKKIKDYEKRGTVADFINTIFFPNTAESRRQGKEPTNADALLDVLSLTPLGFATKLNGVKRIAGASGIGVGGNLLKDMIDEARTEHVYEEGLNGRSEKGDPFDPEVLRLKERASDMGLTLASLLGLRAAGSYGVKAKNKVNDVTGGLVDKVYDKAATGFDKLFGGGKAKKAASSAKRKMTKLDNEKEGLLKELDLNNAESSFEKNLHKDEYVKSYAEKQARNREIEKELKEIEKKKSEINTPKDDPFAKKAIKTGMAILGLRLYNPLVTLPWISKAFRSTENK